MPLGFAAEEVVNGGKEGGDDHDGDSDVVNAKEEDSEALGVAAEQVAARAGEEAEERSSEKDEEGPSSCRSARW